MVMIDKSGHIVLLNRQTEKLFGYTSSELLGQGIELLMPAAERGQHQGRIDRYFVSPAVLDSSERAMGAGRELYGLRKDGSEFPVEIGLTPIHTDDGVMVLGAVVDITLRKQAAEERRQFNQRLEQQVAQRSGWRRISHRISTMKPAKTCGCCVAGSRAWRNCSTISCNSHELVAKPVAPKSFPGKSSSTMFW
jgi:PAS domain S-box-containing protein